MRKMCFFIPFFLVYNSYCQQLVFSDSAVVSLLTCSPSEEVYTKFGHAAIRVNDSMNGKDYVFNYGVFSFNTKNFYYKFVKGETDYQLGVYEMDYFLPEYEERNSIVTEQILNLTVQEKRNLINSLMLNYNPENRFYRYNFVFDNCATRPRDQILNCIQGKIQYGTTQTQLTFRQWITKYVGRDNWLMFGIDLIFGKDADRVATQPESAFLPNNLMLDFQQIKIKDSHNNTRDLISKKSDLLAYNPYVQKPHHNQSNPLLFTVLLLIVGVILTVVEVLIRKRFVGVDVFLLTITGISGFLIFFLMFISVHPMVKNNFNILWLNPLNVFFAILMFVKTPAIQQKTIPIISSVFLVLWVVALVIGVLGIQVFHPAAYPLLILLIVRFGAYRFRKIRA